MAHSAYPHLGESAIEKLVDVLADLREVPLPQDPLLGAATMNIGVISGGRAPNVVPDHASAQIVIRTVKARRRYAARSTEVVGGRCECEFLRDTPPLIMEKLDGYETDVVAFTTDLPSLTRWGRPCCWAGLDQRGPHRARVRSARLIWSKPPNFIAVWFAN